MTDVRTDPASTVVPVSALNQYLYCPRRYWYYRFFDPRDRSAALVEGQTQHKNQSRRPGWIRERYLRSETLRLHGHVDVVDESKGGSSDISDGNAAQPVPIERKRGASGQFYWNDEVQVTAYGLLIEHTVESIEAVDYGVVYLYETDERHRVQLTDERREAVRETRDAILELEPDDPPDTVDNRNKCGGCSVRHRCQPETEAYIERNTSEFKHESGGS